MKDLLEDLKQLDSELRLRECDDDKPFIARQYRTLQAIANHKDLALVKKVLNLPENIQDTLSGVEIEEGYKKKEFE